MTRSQNFPMNPRFYCLSRIPVWNRSVSHRGRRLTPGSDAGVTRPQSEGHHPSGKELGVDKE